MPPAQPTRRAQSPAAGQPPILPAHPLPQYRSRELDYDRYLEASSNKFKIFSAETRRQRKRTLATAAAVAALVVIVIIWAVLSQGQGA